MARTRSKREIAAINTKRALPSSRNLPTRDDSELALRKINESSLRDTSTDIAISETIKRNNKILERLRSR
jgi:hypothetical protein